MRKTLLFLLVALLMPALSWGQNMALTKVHTAYSDYSTAGKTETRVQLPYEAAVGHAMPAQQTDSYSVGLWFRLDEYSKVSVNDAQYKCAVLARLSCPDHLNLNGNWALSVDAEGHFRIWGHDKAGEGGANTAGVGIGGVITEATISLAQWYHVVLSVDNANHRIALYLDGNKIKEWTTTTNLIYGGEQGWDDGIFSFADYGFTGALDEVQLWNHGLSDEEATLAHVNASATNGLTGLYSFNTNATTFPNEVPGATDATQGVYYTYTAGRFFADGLTGVNSSWAPDWSQVEASSMELTEGREIPATEVTVTVTDGEGGTLSLTDGENTYTAGEYQILTGTELTVTATPEEGYELVKITVTNGTAVTEIANGGSFMVTADATVTAVYSNELYTLTVNPAEGIDYVIKRGGVEVTDLTKMIGGEEYTLELTVPDSKKVTAVTLGDQALTATDGVYTFTMSADATLEIAAEDKATYTVTFDECTGGTVSATRMVDGVARNVASGETVTEGTVLTLSNAPAQGYIFNSYVVNGTSTSNATVTVDSDVTISAVFEERLEADYTAPSGDGASGSNCYVETASTTGAKSDISISRTKKNGTNYELCDDQIIVVNPGQQFTMRLYAKHTNTNTAVEPSPHDLRYCMAYIFTDWNADGVFEQVQRYGVKADETGFAGHIAANYNTVMDINHAFTVPENATLGRTRIRVIYTEAWDVNASATISGNYQTIDKGYSYDYVVNVAPSIVAERTITIESAVESMGTVAFTNPASSEKSITTTQGSVSMTATPAEGAAFLSWTNAEGTVVSTSPTYVYNGETDATFTANFGYVVTYTVGNGGTAVVAGADGMALASGVILAPGSEITVTATPDANWKLLAITVNGERTTDNPATITVNSATEIGVLFTDAAYALTINVTGNGSVRVADDFDDAPAGTEYYNGDALALGTQLYVFFIPEAGYKLESATVTGNADGNLTFPDDPEELFELYNDTDYLVYVSTNGDLVINATFASSTVGIDGITADDENAPVEYFNLQGVRVNAENLSTGFYIRRQGSKTAKVFVTK